MSQPKSFQGIMVSSTFTDLVKHRAAVKNAIEKLGFHAVVMESSGANADADVIETSLRMVRDAAAYIGVLTHRYGQTPEDAERNPHELSITELEFDEAMRLERPILLFVMDDEHPVRRRDIETDPAKVAKLEAFKVKAKQMRVGAKVERIWETFASPEDFAVKVAVAVGRLITGLSAPDAPVDVHAKLDDIMRMLSQNGMVEQARDGNVSEAAVRAYLERALDKGFAENDIVSWLPEWIERAQVVFSTGGNDDVAFRKAIAEAEALLEQKGQVAASQPIMDDLARLEAGEAEMAEEFHRRKLSRIEKAIAIDELALNIEGVVEKLFKWAEIEGNTTDEEVARFVHNKAQAYYQTAPHTVSATPLLITRDACAAIRQSFDQALSPWLTGAVLNSLGMVFDSLGERLAGEAGVRGLNEARNAFEAALVVCVQEDFSTEWAMTQNNLGNVLRKLADRGGGEARLETLALARGAYEEALGVFTREDFPENWGTVQNNLGSVLEALVSGSGGKRRTRLLTQARDIYEAALTIRIRESVPVEWATT